MTTLQFYINSRIHSAACELLKSDTR